MNSSKLEELAASLVEDLKKKSQRRDEYLKLAKTAITALLIAANAVFR